MYRFMTKCFLCDQPRQAGPHVYELTVIRRWGVEICRSCIDSNWDGFVPALYPKLVRRLESIDEDIYNEKGLIPLPKGH